jgi:hypothetical protein
LDFKWIVGIVTTLNTAIILFLFLDYLKFRFKIPETYVLKDDCQRINDHFVEENKEDHKLIFDKLDKILLEVSKKADR